MPNFLRTQNPTGQVTQLVTVNGSEVVISAEAIGPEGGSRVMGQITPQTINAFDNVRIDIPCPGVVPNQNVNVTREFGLVPAIALIAVVRYADVIYVYAYNASASNIALASSYNFWCLPL